MVTLLFGYLLVTFGFIVLFILWPEFVLIDFSPFEGKERVQIKQLANAGAVLHITIVFIVTFAFYLDLKDSIITTLVATFCFLYIVTTMLCYVIVRRVLRNP
ncbi:MAG: hypothetical protein Q7S01_01845 [bacterium]|nr:hypothetical protein [bacterium]